MLDNLTILDFETTGLNPEWDFVTEIGALRLRNGIVVQRFSSLVNFGGVVPEKITELTGITQQDIEAGMSPKTAFAQLRALIGDSVVVAHNAAFDLAFLNRSYNRYGSEGLTVTNNWLCTKRLAQECLMYEVSAFGLKDLCKHFEIEQQGHHRALNDAIDCEEILRQMLPFAFLDSGETDVAQYCARLYNTPSQGQSHASYHRWVPGTVTTPGHNEVAAREGWAS